MIDLKEIEKFSDPDFSPHTPSLCAWIREAVRLMEQETLAHCMNPNTTCKRCENLCAHIALVEKGEK